MSIDWSIDWNEKRPGEGELLALVQWYIGGAGQVSAWKGGFIVYLPGEPSRAIPPSLDWMKPHLPEPGVRGIEVFTGMDDGVMVTVRLCDEFTMAVAAGLAEVIARIWGAELTRPS